MAIIAAQSRLSTYDAAIAGVAVAASATNVFTIAGASGKVIRVRQVRVSGIQGSAAGVHNVLLYKQSSADSGGTSSSVTAVPTDSAFAAASATVLSYTANPTVGTQIGLLRADKFTALLSTGTSAQIQIVWRFGGPGVVLRGTAEVLAVHFNAETWTATNSCNFAWNWTEE
jgi:hypothetical protein